MLVLSRKAGEEIIVGENIKIIVTKIDGGRVAIGIEAPKNVRIVRSELSINEPGELPETVVKRSGSVGGSNGPRTIGAWTMQRQVG